MLCPPLTPLNRRPNVPNLPDPHRARPPAQRVRCVPSMFDRPGVKVPGQPDGGEGLAKRKGIIARWCLKEAWSKTAT